MDIQSTFILYIIVSIVSLFFIKIANSYHNNYKKDINSLLVINKSSLFMILSFVVLYLLMALRDYVGADYYEYLSRFYAVGYDNLNLNERTWFMQSPMFYIICKSLVFFNQSHVMMFAVMSFVTLMFFFKAIEHISVNWTLSLYLLLCFCLYFQAFNQVRQMAAISVVMYSYKYLLQNDFKKYIFTMIIAMSFHATAGIFFFAWFFRNKNVNIKTLLMFLLAGIGIFIFFDKLINFFSFINYIQVYSKDQRYSSAFDMSTILNLVVRILMIVFCLLFYKTTIKRAPYTKALYNIAILCTLFQVCAVSFNIFARLTTYYYITYLFLIPEVTKTITEYFTRENAIIIKGITYICFAVYFLVYYFSPSGALGSGYLYYNSWIF